MTADSLPSDEDLVRRCVAEGSDEAFLALVTRYRDRVFRLAASILGPGFDAEAEDVAQEVFVLVHRKLATFRSESRFSTWLYAITRRRAIDVARRARFQRPHLGDEALAQLAGPGEERERRLDLLAAVNALGEPQRSTILLHYWQGQSIDEIATLHSVRPGTVKARLHRARARLGNALEEHP